MDVYPRYPMPSMLNTFSIRNDPARMMLITFPRPVTIGMSEFLSAWTKMTRRLAQALGVRRAHVILSQIFHQRVLHQDRERGE